MSPSSLLLLIVVLAFSSPSLQEETEIDTGNHNNHARFEGGEHRSAVNNGYITMVDSYNHSGIAVKNFSMADYLFTNLQGVSLYTYGDIVGFAGDFFGPVNELSIICTASSQLEAKNLFYKAFIQMWNTNDADYISRIRKEMQREIDAIMDNPNTLPYRVFAKLPESRWVSVFSSKLELGLLLTNNLDHFSSCATFAYSAGHLFAMQTANQAAMELQQCYNITDSSAQQQCMKSAIYTLQTAYAMNAYADHYLTDLFASGHVRTPRRLITTTCIPSNSYITSFLGASSAGGLASQWMHDEDNRNGLFVTNKRGDVWFALGDDNYFDSKNADNRAMINEAVQISRDEVFAAFSGTNASFGALLLIPDSSQLDRFAPNNTCPLFYVDQATFGTVLIREGDQVRPDSWRVRHGFPGDPNQNYCSYTAFTFDQCPHAILSKVESELPAWVATAYTQKMDYSMEDEAWVTLRPDTMAYSNKPIIVFAVAAILLGSAMSFAFLLFECFYAGFGKCHPSGPMKVWPMSWLSCCWGRGGWQLGWIFSTALFPALLTCILGMVLFEIIFITMPDIYSAVPQIAWVVFFTVGFAVAFFSRFFFYNWLNYCRARFHKKAWLHGLRGDMQKFQHEEKGKKAENVDDEFTSLLP